jgi:hypothetical protein
MRPRSVALDRVGAALPGVLLVMFWLTGIGGWLVALSLWDLRMHVVDEDTAALTRAADALAEVMARRLADVADWQGLLDAGAEVGCPASTAPLPAAIDLAGETIRLQASTDALSRWTGAAHPVWRFIAGCDAESLQGEWRGRGATPWLLAWVANTPGGTGVEPPTQLALHLVALHPVRGRSARTVTLRRFPGEMSPRIVAWHPE